MPVINLEEIAARNSKLYSRILLTRVRDLMLDIRQAELTPYNITPRQAYILEILFKLGRKATLAQLAKYNEREANTISVAMTKMEKEGLVRKFRNSKRSTLLVYQLTKKGLETYHQTKKQTSEKAIMSALSEEERQQFMAMLKKIFNKAGKYRKMQLREKVTQVSFER
jgi:DNA-binding MarR family transcriptional regulator